MRIQKIGERLQSCVRFGEPTSSTDDIIGPTFGTNRINTTSSAETRVLYTIQQGGNEYNSNECTNKRCLQPWTLTVNLNPNPTVTLTNRNSALPCPHSSLMVTLTKCN